MTTERNNTGRKRGGSVILQGAPEPIAALNRIPITEYLQPYDTREPLVDVRHHCPNIQLTDRVCPYLRRHVADMLNRANLSLPAGHVLRAGTCLRTLTMQKDGYDRYYGKVREAHPGWPLSALKRAVNKYFAPYDQPAPPGHCTGAAIDVAILGPDGEPLDVLGSTVGWEAAYTWSDKIGDAARVNRMLMVDAMLGAGFSNCRDEYWHYSWGDSAWAVRSGASECPYGWVYPPVDASLAEGHESISLHHPQTVRDALGRPVRAEISIDQSASMSNEAVHFKLRLNWANNVPVTLRLHALTGTASTALFNCVDGEQVWQKLDEYHVEHSATVFHFVPAADRIIISNRPENLSPE